MTPIIPLLANVEQDRQALLAAAADVNQFAAFGVNLMATTLDPDFDLQSHVFNPVDSLGDIAQQVLLFHEKYVPEKIAFDTSHCHIEADEVAFRLGFLDEELNELKEAIKTGDRAGELDAYVDLCWVAIGSAIMRFGIDAFDAAATAVFVANMQKIRKEGEFKIQKPAGWTAPDIGKVIADHA